MSDWLGTLMSDLGRWPSGAGLWLTPLADSCWLTQKPETLREASQVEAALRAYLSDHADAAGWVECTGATFLVGAGQPMQLRGPLLNAELCSAKGASLHVRQRGRCGWLLNRLHEASAFEAPNDKEAIRCVALDERHASADGGASAFVYRCYLGLDDTGTLRPVAARLLRVERPRTAPSIR